MRNLKWLGRKQRYNSAENSPENFATECLGLEKSQPSIAFVLAAWSQVLMLAVVIFGYFYTVRPIFQYQLLEEKSAQLEIEKKNLRSQVVALSDKEKDLVQKISSLDFDVSKAENLISKLQSDIAGKKEDLKIAKGKTNEALIELERVEKKLWLARWKNYITELKSASLSSLIDGALYTTDDIFDVEKEIKRSKSDWPSPYKDLLKEINHLSKNGSYPNKFREVIINKMDESIDFLTCKEMNWGSILNRYHEDLRESKRKAKEASENYIEKLVRSYREKGERVRITEEFKSRSLRTYIEHKKIDVQSEYISTINRERIECRSKINDFIGKFQKYIGVKFVN